MSSTRAARLDHSVPPELLGQAPRLLRLGALAADPTGLPHPRRPAPSLLATRRTS